MRRRTSSWTPARVSTRLFGQDQFAILVLVGAAYQSGALPIPAEAIEQAIR